MVNPKKGLFKGRVNTVYIPNEEDPQKGARDVMHRFEVSSQKCVVHNFSVDGLTVHRCYVQV